MLEEERKMEEGGGVEYINTLFLAWQKGKKIRKKVR